MIEQARQDGQQALSRATQAAEHLRTEIEQVGASARREIMTQAQKYRTADRTGEIRAEPPGSDLAIMAAERVSVTR